MNFQHKLLLAFVSLLVLAMGVTGVAVSITNSTYVSSSMQDQLSVGAEIFRNHLNNRAEQLATSARVLTSDFGFITAVATKDTATIASVLTNHGKRINADMVMLADPQGGLISASDAQMLQTGRFPFNDLLVEAAEKGEASAITIWNGVAYQLFVLPVKAPSTIAWAGMAFALDEQVIRTAADMGGIQIGLFTQQRNELVRLGSSAGTSAGNLSPERVFANTGKAYVDGNYLTLVDRLSAASSTAVTAPIIGVFQLSTDIISAATAELIYQLGVILVVTLSVCLLISLWMARRMSNPVAVLIGAAKNIHQGDYTSRVEVESGGEMALLGDAINTMAEGIAEREQRIRRHAYVDPICGLPNKLALIEALDGCAGGVAIAQIELLDANDIQFSFGFEVGEELVRACAQRLINRLGAEQVFVLAENQLGVMLPGLNAEEARSRLHSLMDVLATPCSIDTFDVMTRVAAGVVHYPSDAEDATSLLRRCATTLDKARTRSGSIELYLPGHEEERQRQLTIIRAFDDAFEQNQFHLVYQPKVDVAGRRVVEAEALLRWIHPELGFIPPDEFIVLAEYSGKIRRLTTWVLREAIRQSAIWHRSDLPICVAVNLSAHDLADPELARQLQGFLTEFDAKPDMISLEITESAVLRDEARAIEVLVKFKRLGIRLAIDDFGTGYSSLAQLKSLPVDELKIDKSFVLQLDSSSDDEQIVRSTIDLGHNLNLKIVAEGIENQISLNMLEAFGCDKVQGYFFSKPLAADDFFVWCTSFKWSNFVLQEIEQRA